MKRKKILYTISNFNTAGSGKVVYDLVKGLNALDVFDIEISCGNSDGDFFNEVKQLGVPVHVFSTKTNYRPYYTLISRIWKIRNFYKTHQYDLVHSWQWSGDWTEAFAAKLAGIKWIYTKKAMGFDNFHWQIKSYLADFIVTINTEMQQYFSNKKQQALIPLGIDTNYYQPKKTVNKSNSRFHIVMVANLVPVKGLEVLLTAIWVLNDPNIQLTVVGYDGNSYGQDMKSLSERLQLSSQVVFKGRQLDVRPFIDAADLYIIPTLDEGRKEGMPMALVEAMSMAIPVLGSDITGINFVLKDFKHLLFKAGNHKDLATHIRQLQQLSEVERNTLGASLRSYCMQHYNIKTFVNAHEVLYFKLLNL